MRFGLVPARGLPGNGLECVKLGVSSDVAERLMPTPSDYRRRARECMDMAESAGPTERNTLMQIAEAWLQLAADAERENAVLGAAAAGNLHQDDSSTQH